MSLQDEELKALAEFAAGELGCKRLHFSENRHYELPEDIEYWDLITGSELGCLPFHMCQGFRLPDVFFHDPETAPILKHLMEEKLIKTHDLQYQTVMGPMLEVVHRWNLIPKVPPYVFDAGCEDENNFYAFWQAVKELRGVKDG